MVRFGAALAAVLLQLIAPELVLNLRYPLLIAVILILGIPHGAIDHIITSQLFNLPYSLKGQLPFYAFYFMAMGLMAFIWLWNPIIGFLGFICITIYHFGQADLNFLNLPPATKRILFISRGAFILILIIFSDWTLIGPVISSIMYQPISSVTLFSPSAWMSAGLIQFVLINGTILLLYRKQLTKPTLTYFVADSTFVITLFFIVDPFLAFAVYFGTWHCSGHIQQMLLFLKNTDDELDLTDFYRKAFPLTAAAVLGLCLLLILRSVWPMSIELIFVIFISVLTLPHMLIVEKMYEFKERKAG